MNKIKKLKNYPVIIIFMLVIFGFSIIDIVTPEHEYSSLENKYLAQGPKFNFSDFVDNIFVPKYENYIDDQFVFRNYWINLKSRSEYYLGKLENNGVLYAKDNYLFDKNSSIDENKALRNLMMIEKFIKNNPNEKIDFALVPNSYEILKDKIPYLLELFNQSAYIDKNYGKVEKYDNVQTIDLIGSLKAHEDEYIYYRTDHHWTSYGAYLAYEAYMQNIGEKAIKYDENKCEKISGFLGTYFSKCKKFDVLADTIEYFDYNDLSMTIAGKKMESIYDYKKFDSRDKYAAFLHGNNDITIIRNNNLKNDTKKKIMVIKDSFGNSFVPFLTNNFDEIYVVDLRANTENVSSIIENVDFDNILILYSVGNFVKDNNFIKLNN